MALAITIWSGQVATVADFARRMLVVEVEGGQVRSRRTSEMPAGEVPVWSARLGAAGATTLICGAISRHMHRCLSAAGVEVVDGCAGGIEEVLADWLAGTIDSRRRGPACRWAAGLSAIPRPRPSHLPALQEHAMSIALSATGPGLDDALDPRFGRCRHILVCAEGAEPVHHANPAQGAEHGAGIRTAEFVAGLGVATVVTGAVGPKAMEVLRAAGIRAFASPPGTVREALARMRAGVLPEA